jgi:hypothetical protein
LCEIFRTAVNVDRDTSDAYRQLTCRIGAERSASLARRVLENKCSAQRRAESGGVVLAFALLRRRVDG